MTEQDRFNAEMQLKTSLQEAKFNMLVNELKEQCKDIRRLQDKQDEDRKSLEAKIDRLGDKIQNLTIAAVVGIGAIVIGGGAIIWSAIKLR